MSAALVWVPDVVAQAFHHPIWRTPLVPGSDAWERAFVEWMHPGFNWATRATRDWPLTRMDHALAATLAYLALVAFGLWRYSASRKAGEGEGEGEAGAKESRFRLPTDPVRWAQVVYNTVQVLLCSWMVVAAAVTAHEEQYSVLCNRFDARSSRMASVEIVFYLSKVRHAARCSQPALRRAAVTTTHAAGTQAFLARRLRIPPLRSPLAP